MSAKGYCPPTVTRVPSFSFASCGEYPETTMLVSVAPWTVWTPDMMNFGHPWCTLPVQQPLKGL